METLLWLSTLELRSQRSRSVSRKQARIDQEQRELARRRFLRELEPLHLRELHTPVSVPIEAGETAREFILSTRPAGLPVRTQ